MQDALADAPAYTGSYLSYAPAPASDNPFLSPPLDASNPFASPPPPNPFLPVNPTPPPSTNGGQADFSRKQSARQSPPTPPAPSPAPRPPGFGAGLTDVASTSDHAQPPADLSPKLELPILDTGLEDEALRHLAFYVFMACRNQPAQGTTSKPQQTLSAHQHQQRHALARTVREQLHISEALSKGLSTLLPLLTSSVNEWTPARLCSMEGLASLMRLARPSHFETALSSNAAPAAPQRASSGAASKMMDSVFGSSKHGVASSHGLSGSSPRKSGEESSSEDTSTSGVGKLAPPVAPFEVFLQWRRSTAAAMRAAAHAAVAPWWEISKAQQQEAGNAKAPQQVQTARKALARLCGALRRMDVPHEDEMDEEEYAEAAAATMGASSTLALLSVPPQHAAREGGAAHVGWTLPWALRARVAETLLFAVFCSLDSSAYVDEAVALAAYLEGVVWPALGIKEPLALALNAWVHFRQYVVTGDITLSRQIKHMLAKLAATSPSQPAPGAWVSPSDQVTAEVRKVSVAHLVRRLSDYHLKFPQGKEGEMQAMIEVLAFAQRLAPEEGDLAGIVTGLARNSACKQFARLMGPRVSTTPSVEQALLDALGTARAVLQAEEKLYAPILAPHYPQQAAVPVMAGTLAEVGTRQHLAETSAAVHALLGQQLLLPWMQSGLKLDPLVANVFSAALKFDNSVAAFVAAATDDPATVRAMAAKKGTEAEAETLATFAKWPLTEPLKVVTVDWASWQVERLNTWVTRQLQQETWLAVNGQDGCAQSAVEILKLVEDSLESLYALGLPLRFEGRLGALDVLMCGVDTTVEIFAQAILSKLGSTAKLVPPPPPVMRYKKEAVVKQESAEASLMATANSVPPPPKRGPRMRIPGSKGWTASTSPNSISLLDLLATVNFKAGRSPTSVFLESVPRVGVSPDYATMHKTLTNPVIICCLMSAQFLLDRLDGLVNTAYKRLDAPGAIITAPSPTREGKPEYLAVSRRALTNALMHSCNFLCCKAIYWDMRSAWCEHLYRHRVIGGAPLSIGMDSLIEALNQVLADVGHQLPDKTRSLFAAEMLKVVCEAYNRVLLDGGPCRWFSPSDVPVLEADLKQLALLFEAEGEGLPRPLIREIMAATYRVLELVRMETPALMDALKAARKEAAASASGVPGASSSKMMRKLMPGGTEVPMHPPTLRGGTEDPSTVAKFSEGELMRALARRPERVGSKLLKEKYGTPIVKTK